MKKKIVLFTLVLCLFLVFSSPFAGASSLFNRNKTVTISADEYEALLKLQKYEKLDLLLWVVQNYYYKDVDVDDLMDSAMKGLVLGTEDIYSKYLTEEDYNELNEETDGLYAGIGCLLLADPESKLITVTRVYKDSPAEKAGILIGDQIVYVNDEYYTAYEMDEAVSIMRGHPGESVKITVFRDLETIDFEIVREYVTINYAEYEILPENIGYIEITNFYGEATEVFAKAIEDFKANDVSGMIIDLRGNTGGLVNVAHEIADMILPEGVVVSMRDKNGRTKELKMDDEYFEIPIAVLINDSSASASEILSGAIKDYGAGTLVGTKTFGKGVVQTILDFGDGTGVELTTETYYTPSGACIHEIGIEPDIECEMDEEAAKLYKYNKLTHDKDNQLQTAIAVLKGEPIPEKEVKTEDTSDEEKLEKNETNVEADTSLNDKNEQNLDMEGNQKKMLERLNTLKKMLIEKEETDINAGDQ